MRVLVFEQWQGGHYFNYLEYLVPRLMELADEVVVTMTQRALDSDAFQAKLGAVARLPGVRFEGSVPRADPSLPARERFQILRNLQNAVAATRPDYLMVPSADAQTPAMAAWGHFGIHALPRDLPSEATFHCGYGPPLARRKHQIKELIYRGAYAGSTWTYLNFVNFHYLNHAQREGRAWVGRARLVADPVPRVTRLGRGAARRLLGIPEDGRYLGLLGELDPRKAIPELLAAFRTANLGIRDRLLLGGRLDAGFRDLLAREYRDLLDAGRIILIDRYLTDDELLKGFGALDVVCATYRDFPGLASLMLKGIAAGRPVIAQDFGWSGALIRRFQVGHTVAIDRTADFAATLRLALEESESYVESAAVERLLAFHEPRNFAFGMTERLRVLTGKPEAQDVKSWDWVVGAES